MTKLEIVDVNQRKEGKNSLYVVTINLEFPHQIMKTYLIICGYWLAILAIHSNLIKSNTPELNLDKDNQIKSKWFANNLSFLAFIHHMDDKSLKRIFALV